MEEREPRAQNLAVWVQQLDSVLIAFPNLTRCHLVMTGAQSCPGGTRVLSLLAEFWQLRRGITWGPLAAEQREFGFLGKPRAAQVVHQGTQDAPGLTPLLVAAPKGQILVSCRHVTLDAKRATSLGAWVEGEDGSLTLGQFIGSLFGGLAC